MFKVGRPLIHSRSPVQLPFLLRLHTVCSLKVIIVCPTDTTLEYWYYILFVDKKSFLRRVCKIANIDCSSCFCVRLPVRTEQLGSNSTNFYEIWHLSIFRKSVENFQVALKYDNSNGYLKTNIHFWSCLAQVFLRMKKCLRRNLWRKKTHFMFNNCVSKILSFMR